MKYYTLKIDGKDAITIAVAVPNLDISIPPKSVVEDIREVTPSYDLITTDLLIKSE